MADTLAILAEPKKYADWMPPTVAITRQDDEVTIMATPLLADRRMIDAASVRVRVGEDALLDWLAHLVASLPADRRASLYDHVVSIDTAQTGA